LLAGLGVSAVLGMQRLRFLAAMMVAIILAAMLHHALMPASSFATPKGDAWASLGKLDFSVIAHSQFWLPVIVFFVLDFFEGIGEFIGLTSNTSIQDKDGNVPHVKQALWVDSAGTVAGSLLGTSSLIVFVESAVGIRAGGRTGLTAVVCALLMMFVGGVGFYLAPLLALVPAEAASGVLVYVGYLIVSGAFHSRKDHGLSSFDFGVVAIMAAISLLTFSLDKSLAFGLWAYFARSFSAGKKPAWWLAAIAAALTAAIVFSG
jgi:AGZA family xanthine/uracil permease-like MFS transporter